MPNPVEGLLEVYEDMVVVNRMLCEAAARNFATAPPWRVHIDGAEVDAVSPKIGYIRNSKA